MAVLLSLTPSAFAIKNAEADPADAPLAKADELTEQANYEGAQQALLVAERFLGRKDPRHVRIQERRGAILLREGRLSEARGLFTQAIQTAGALKVTDSSLARAYAGMGLCLMKEGRPKFALKFFRRGLGSKPDEGTKAFLEERIREIEGATPAAN